MPIQFIYLILEVYTDEVTAHRDPCPSSSLGWREKRDHQFCAHLFCHLSTAGDGARRRGRLSIQRNSWLRDRQLFSILGGGFHWFPSVSVHCCCCNKSSQTQWSKQYKCILLQLWRLKSPMVWQGCFPSGSSVDGVSPRPVHLSEAVPSWLVALAHSNIASTITSPLSRTLLPLFLRTL